MDDTETTNCPICGQNQFKRLFERRDLLYNESTELFCVVRCTNCATEYLNPRPTRQTIGKYYTSQYPVHSSEKAARVRFADYGVIKQRRFVEKYVKRGRILDIGAGTGEFVSEMLRSGWVASGVEYCGDADFVSGADRSGRWNFWRDS